MKAGMAVSVTKAIDALAPDERAAVIHRWNRFLDGKEWVGPLEKAKIDLTDQPLPAFLTLWPIESALLSVGVWRDMIVLHSFHPMPRQAIDRKLNGTESTAHPRVEIDGVRRSARASKKMLENAVLIRSIELDREPQWKPAAQPGEADVPRRRRRLG